MRRRWTWMLALSLLLAGGWACGADPEEEAAAANEAEWQALQETKAQLDAKRQELADLRAELEAMPAEGSEAAEEAEAEATAAEEAGTEPATSREELEQRIATLEDEIATESEQFASRLVNYINSLEIVEGEPLTPDQQAAIRMKSDEDLMVAREWIEKGGDYRRAISIYEAALALDPDNEEVQAALAEAEEMRYMTEERFAGVEEGMSRAEVRNVLGPVNLHNVQEYPEENTIAWFYPKEETRTPAAVWFRLDQETGQYEVYKADFEAQRQEE